MMLNLMAVLYIFRFFAKAATNHHKEHRHEEDRQDRRGHHPAHYACTDGVLRTAVTPNSNASFHTASLFSSRALSFAVCERPENYVLAFAVRISRDI